MTSRTKDADDGFYEALPEDNAVAGAAGADAQSDPGEYSEEDGEYDDEEGEEEEEDDEGEFDDASDYEYHGGIDQSEHDADVGAGVAAEEEEAEGVSETPQAEFRCVFTRGGSVQGKLLLLRTRMVFVPHFFSTARVSLAYAAVVQIHKRNTALIFPNAIEFVTADGQRYLFTSFIARDQAYAAICTTLRAFTERDHVMEFSVSEHSERLASDAEGDTPAPPVSDSAPASPRLLAGGSPDGPAASSSSSSSLASPSAPAAAAAGLLAVSVPTTPVAQGDAAASLTDDSFVHIDAQTTPAKEQEQEQVAEQVAEAAPTKKKTTAATAAAAAAAVAAAPTPEGIDAMLEVQQEGCAKHFSAELRKAPEWKREDVALPPARVHGVLFGAGTRFWDDVYGDMQYTNVACGAWARADGCGCLQRGVEFDTVVTHSLVGTKNCHVRNVQYLTRPAADVLEFVTQTHLGPELPYSTSYYAEAFVRIASAPAPAPARGATVAIGFRTVFVKSVFVRGIIEKSAIAGLYPLYEKFFARLRAACDAATAAPAPAPAPASAQSRTPRRLRKGPKRAPAKKGAETGTAGASSASPAPASPPRPVAAAAVPAAPVPAASGAPAVPAASGKSVSQGEWLRQLVRIVVVPLRTPSLVRDLVAALLLSLLVSGFVTSALRVQVEAQGAQLHALTQQVADLQARLAAADTAPDGVCPADAVPPSPPSSPLPTTTPTATALREEDIARILAFLGEARDLADTLGAAPPSAAAAPPAAPPRTRGTLPRPSKQERWTTVLVAALILVTALVFIFFRTA